MLRIPVDTMSGLIHRQRASVKKRRVYYAAGRAWSVAEIFFSINPIGFVRGFVCGERFGA